MDNNGGEEERALWSSIMSVARGESPQDMDDDDFDARMYSPSDDDEDGRERRRAEDAARQSQLTSEYFTWANDLVRDREEEEGEEEEGRRVLTEEIARAVEEGEDVHERVRRLADGERQRQLAAEDAMRQMQLAMMPYAEQQRIHEEDEAAERAVGDIYPEAPHDLSNEFNARLQAIIPRHVPGDKEPVQWFRVAGAQATEVGGTLFDNRIESRMNREQIESLALNYGRAKVRVPLHGNIATIGALRDYIREMPVGSTLTATITDANVDQLYKTFKAHDGYVFMIEAQLLAVTVYPRARGRNTYVRYIYAAGIGDDIFNPDEHYDDAAYGYHPEVNEDGAFESDVVYTTTTMNIPIYIQKLPRRMLATRVFPRIIRAGGFDHVCLPEHTYFVENFAVYFPACVPSDSRNCLVYCVWRRLQDVLQDCSPAVCARLWDTLMVHRSRKGDYTTQCINMLNESLRDLAPVLGFNCAVYLYHRDSRQTNDFKLSNQKNVGKVWGPEGRIDIPIRVSRINYYGEFITRRGVHKIPGGAHYVLLDRLSVSMNGLEAIEQALREHISRKWDIPFGELYAMNKKMMEEKDDEVRKKMRQRRNQVQEKRTLDLRLAIWDLECLVERQDGDEMDCDDDELRRIQAEEPLHHVPCMFSWGVVNVEKSIADRWEDAYLSAMPPMETMTPDEVDKLSDIIFYTLAGGQKVEVYTGTEQQNYQDTIRSGIEGMFHYMREHKLEHMVALAHNASSYDNFLAAKNFYPIDAAGHPWITIENDGYLQTGRGILKLTFRCEAMTLSLQCSKVHFGASLEKLGESFKIPHSIRKLPWDFEKDFITRTRLRNPDFLENLQTYAAYDIYSLGTLVSLFEQFHREIFPITDFDKVPRMGSCTYQEFLRKWLRTTRLFRTYIPNQLPLYDDTLLQSLRGGISLAPTREYITNIWVRSMTTDVLARVNRESDTFEWVNDLAREREEQELPGVQAQDVIHAKPELWQELLKQIHEDDSSLVSLDNNSLYPYAQTHPVPRGPGRYLTGEECAYLLRALSDVDHPREWGIVCATIRPDSFPDDCFPFFSTRREGGLGLRYCRPDEPITTYFTSLDLITYAWAGAELEVHHGVWWVDENDLSIEYVSVIEELFQRRAEATDDVQKGIYKTACVSTFGTTGRKISPVKDIVLQVSPEEQVSPDELVVGRVQRAVYLPSCTIVRMKAHFTHLYDKLSTKSTITNNILSRARYHMMRCIRMVGLQYWVDDEPEEAFRKMLREVHYTDTDSVFVQQKWVREFDKCGLISGRLGDFKNDYDGVIPHLFAGAPKNRQTEVVYLDKSCDPPTYKLRVISKFKGMPMKKKLENPCVQRDVFADVNRDFSCVLDKTVWKRSLNGVNTQQCPYEVTPQSLMKDKRGVLGEVDKLGNVRIRNVQIGDMLPLTLEYPALGLPKPDADKAIAAFIDRYNEMRTRLLSQARSL